MKITEKEVRYVADLANLRLTDDEVKAMTHDLDEVLEHIDKLSKLDTAGVEPMAQVLYDAEETASLRPDREHVPLGNEAAMANAPQHGSGYFKIPKVIER